MLLFDLLKTDRKKEPKAPAAQNESKADNTPQTELTPLSQSILNESSVGGYNVYTGSDSSNLAGVMNDMAGTSSDLNNIQGDFIGDSFYDTGGIFGRPFGNPGLLEVERAYIMQQRTISLYPEVAIGIEEIMRDLFSKDSPFNLNTNSEEDNYDHIQELFEDFRSKPFTVISNTRTPDPLITFNFLKQTYIDGRIAVLTLLVDKEQASEISSNNSILNTKLNTGASGASTNGLKESMVFWKEQDIVVDADHLNEAKLIQILESKSKARTRLYEAKKKKKEKLEKLEKLDSLVDTDKKTENQVRIFIPIDPVKIHEDQGKIYYIAGRSHKIELEEESIIQSDFGLFDVVGARHGFLLYAFKYANQLQNLQDMLIPMRFRRSVARRVFNVDISMLPHSRAVSYMKDLQSRFKYKKHYDATSGRIVSKKDDPTGIVEDYWFANRSGSKGTTVDTIDEAGNFQDSLDDISYFNKKLYQSMFIPLRRIFESDASYDYTANSIEVDELRFQSFLSRVRFVYDNVITNMFHSILRDNDIDPEGVEVTLNYDNWYEQAKTKEDFENAIDLYESAKPLIGKLFSAETVIDKVFGLTPGDIGEEFERISAEIKEDHPLYPIYLANKEDSDGY